MLERDNMSSIYTHTDDLLTYLVVQGLGSDVISKFFIQRFGISTPLTSLGWEMFAKYCTKFNARSLTYFEAFGPIL
jgi:hypothetical protein